MCESTVLIITYTLYVIAGTQHAIYCIAENTGGIKYWQIQLFRLFGRETFGKWPTHIP